MTVDAPPAADETAADVALAFLRALEARDLSAAAARLAPGATLVFPGPVEFKTLEALIEWAGGRYRWAAKRIVGVDVARADGADVVIVRGVLSGVWLDGTPFVDVRFVDRFVIADGLIRRQEVWNDLAERRAAA